MSARVAARAVADGPPVGGRASSAVIRVQTATVQSRAPVVGGRNFNHLLLVLRGERLPGRSKGTHSGNGSLLVFREK